MLSHLNALFLTENRSKVSFRNFQLQQTRFGHDVTNSIEMNYRLLPLFSQFS